MTAVEDAAVLRAAAQVVRDGRAPLEARTVAGYELGGYLAGMADRLDPPKPPLPSEYGWHPNVRQARTSIDFLPGAWHDREGWRLVLPSGDWARYANGADAERHLTAVEPEPKREPRVLTGETECPEAGSRWRDEVGDVCEVTEPGEYVWIKLGSSGRRGQESWPWRMHASCDRRLTEVLA